MEIVIYPHPALRHKSKPVKRVDSHLRQIVQQMFDLMYEANGVGLAANQINLPLRLFVVNLQGNREEGEELVFINPVISRAKNTDEGEEGCLSLPGVYGKVIRPRQVRVNAYNLAGEEYEADVDGMFARVVQHELDHLDGVLFPDRMTTTGQIVVQPALDEFESKFRLRRQAGEIPEDAEITAQLVEWERRYGT